MFLTLIPGGYGLPNQAGHCQRHAHLQRLLDRHERACGASRPGWNLPFQLSLSYQCGKIGSFVQWAYIC